jgi:hypothetical protein
MRLFVTQRHFGISFTTKRSLNRMPDFSESFRRFRAYLCRKPKITASPFTLQNGTNKAPTNNGLVLNTTQTFSTTVPTQRHPSLQLFRQPSEVPPPDTTTSSTPIHKKQKPFETLSQSTAHRTPLPPRCASSGSTSPSHPLSSVHARNMPGCECAKIKSKCCQAVFATLVYLFNLNFHLRPSLRRSSLS